MKKILFFFVLIGWLGAKGQPVKSSDNTNTNIKDLKSVCKKYCSITYMIKDGRYIGNIEGENGEYYFLMEKGGKDYKSLTSGGATLMNYMYENGWRYLNSWHPNDDFDPKSTYMLFEKREE